MPNELMVTHSTGATVYATIRMAAGADLGKYWNGTAFETFDAGNWTDYDVALTEEGSTGVYVADLPALTAEVLDAAFYVQAGGSPADTDTRITTTPYLFVGSRGWIKFGDLRAISDGQNIALGTSAGTMIGTATNQKLAFRGSTAIVLPAAAAQGATVMATLNGAIAALAISDPPTEAEVEALRDAAEWLADDVIALHTLVHALRTALLNQGLIKGAA